MADASQDPPRTKGERSRQRLVEAALELIREEGIPALTTVSVTAKAGLAQSSFYQHFKNLDACLEEAGEHVAARIRPSRPGLRNEALQMLEKPEDMPRAVDLVLSQTTLQYLKEPELTKLYHRYQYDPSPFGRAMTALVEREREETNTIFWDAARRFGAGPEFYPAVAVTSELCTAMSQGAVSALIYGKFANTDMVIGMLRLMIGSALKGTVEALQRATQKNE